MAVFHHDHRMLALSRCASGLFVFICAAGYVACGSDPTNGGFGSEDAGSDAGTSSGSKPDGSGIGFGGQNDGGIIPVQEPATDVEVVLTADNAYAFGYGDSKAITTLKGRPATASAGDIFNCPVNTTGSGAVGFGPESYTVLAADAPTGAYLYLVTWDDDSVTQGALGQFKRKGGQALYSGAAGWEVCATGKFFSSSPGTPTAAGPAIDVVNADISACNAGTGDKATTSGGWVNAAGAVTAGAVGKLAVGQDNSAAGQFPITCQKDQMGNAGIDPQAHWMWYSPDARDAFNSRGTRSYLIFRLPTKELPQPPK